MRLRSSIRSTSGWVFGLATTVLFISLWGRAVVVDGEALADAASPLAQSTAVSETLSGWLTQQLVERGLEGSAASRVGESVIDSATAERVLDHLASEYVVAAASPGVGPAVIEVGELLAPAVPETVDALAKAGVAVDRAEVARLIAGLDPLVVREAGARPLVGPTSPTASRLGVAGILGLAVMTFSGSIMVVSSENRLLAARALLSRVALGGISFGILLRIGSWIVDPATGRAPISESIAVLAGSKWLVPIAAGALSAGVAVLVGLVKADVRPVEGSRWRGEPPTEELELQPSLPG